jgi:phosphoglycerate dehydrogenase-like enzyme
MEKALGIMADFLTDVHKGKIEAVAAANGVKIHYFTGRADMEAHIGECELLYGYIPPELLADAKSLKWLACASAGVDAYCDPYIYANRGVLLTNSAGAYGITISEHIIMTLLMLFRRMPEYRAVTDAREWKNIGRVRSIYGSTITVVGTGNIGSSFAGRAKALGAKCVRGVHRTAKPLPACFDESYQTADLDFALVGADAVVLCAPGTKETSGLMSKKRIALLGEGAALVSVGRGSILDEDALVDALNAKRLGGAALDVTDTEPLPKDSPLWTARNCIITPHVAGNMSLGVTCDMDVDMFCGDLERYCRGEALAHLVDRSAGY